LLLFCIQLFRRAANQVRFAALPEALLRPSFQLPARATATAAAATAAATATAAARATTTTTEATATAAATGRLRPSFVDVHRTAVEFRTVQLGNCSLGGASIRHFDEGEAAGLTGIPVRDDIHTLDIAVLCKRCVKLILRGLVAEISNEDVGHGYPLLNSSLSDCAVDQIGERRPEGSRYY